MKKKDFANECRSHNPRNWLRGERSTKKCDKYEMERKREREKERERENSNTPTKSSYYIVR